MSVTKLQLEVGKGVQHAYHGTHTSEGLTICFPLVCNIAFSLQSRKGCAQDRGVILGSVQVGVVLGLCLCSKLLSFLGRKLM